MDPEVWGPQYWFFLHSAAYSYPRNPTAIQRKIFYRLMHHFSEYIPHADSANLYRKLLDANPVAPYLDTKEDLMRWTNLMHNKVNEVLRKPLVPFNDFRKKFENPQPVNRRNPDETKWFLLVMIVLVVLTILMCSN